jgi:hypothetical protein
MIVRRNRDSLQSLGPNSLFRPARINSYVPARAKGQSPSETKRATRDAAWPSYGLGRGGGGSRIERKLRAPSATIAPRPGPSGPTALRRGHLSQPGPRSCILFSLFPRPLAKSPSLIFKSSRALLLALLIHVGGRLNVLAASASDATIWCAAAT